MFHLLGIAGTTLLLGLVMVYPFLPGAYDAMAVTFSAMVQVAGAAGLLLVPPGVLWLAYELRKKGRIQRCLSNKPGTFWFALISLVIASVPMLGVTVVALGSVGMSLALPIVALWLGGIAKLTPKLKRLKSAEPTRFNPAPAYLTLLPIFLCVLQFVLVRPLTDFSRNRAMASAEEVIRQIEQHRVEFGRYPFSLLSVHKDYSASVVGVERFHYAPTGEAYSFFFEQPRFLFDRPGTREFVAYNRLDEHVIPSHAAGVVEWPPEKVAVNQGWYAARDTAKPHWKSFWFD